MTSIQSVLQGYLSRIRLFRPNARFYLLTVLVTGVEGYGSGAGVMFEGSESETMALFAAGGWTLLTAINLMLFSLIHNPCSTTIYTIYKETGSRRWTTVSALLPLVLGFIVTFVVALVWRLAAG